MYSVIEKNKNIITFIADVDEDIKEIKDTCDPGSKVIVLTKAEEGVPKVHTFIKTPSEKWVLYEGKSDFNPEED